MPSTERLIRQAGGMALASGIFGLLAVASLLVFYSLLSLHAAQEGWGSTQGAGYPFGLLNDILTLLAALTTLILVLLIPALSQKRVNIFMQVGTLFGVAGSSGITMVMTVFLLGGISLVEQGAYYAIAFGPLGIWHIVVNGANPKNIIPKGLARFGIIMGTGEVVASLSFVVFNGFQILNTADYQSVLNNYPMMFGTMLGGFLGYVGGPIWSVLLGRRLLSSQ